MFSVAQTFLSVRLSVRTGFRRHPRGEPIRFAAPKDIRRRTLTPGSCPCPDAADAGVALADSDFSGPSPLFLSALCVSALKALGSFLASLPCFSASFFSKQNRNRPTPIIRHHHIILPIAIQIPNRQSRPPNILQTPRRNLKSPAARPHKKHQRIALRA